jgi:hypothetical protein
LNGDVDSSVDLIRKQGAHEDDVEFMIYVYDRLTASAEVEKANIASNEGYEGEKEGKKGTGRAINSKC